MNVDNGYFDDAPDRRGSNSYKWDIDAPADVIPLWVADMDFRVAPPIIEALESRVKHGIFGYTHVPAQYYQAVEHWFLCKMPSHCTEPLL